MKSIFEVSVRNELSNRINALSPTLHAQWGKMTTYQMIKHCVMSEEMYLGKKRYKRLFIGRLFGKMALKGILNNDAPMQQNQPTHPDFKIKGSGNFEQEKEKWLQLLSEYASFNYTNFTHPFFGVMTKDQIGKYVYKHTDHHLRQFGV